MIDLLLLGSSPHTSGDKLQPIDRSSETIPCHLATSDNGFRGQGCIDLPVDFVPGGSSAVIAHDAGGGVGREDAGGAEECCGGGHQGGCRLGSAACPGASQASGQAVPTVVADHVQAQGAGQGVYCALMSSIDCSLGLRVRTNSQ